MARSLLTVGGYGTFVSVPTRYDDLTRVLLVAAQRRGRALELRVRFARSSADEAWSRWALDVDGRSHLVRLGHRRSSGSCLSSLRGIPGLATAESLEGLLDRSSPASSSGASALVTASLESG